MKKILAALLSVMMVVVFLPTTALADEVQPPEGYGLEVHDIAITDANKDDVLGDLDGEAKTVTFDPETSTITLNNANFAVEGESYKGGAIVWKYESPITELKISANGSNRFTRVLANSPNPRTLTFTGPGSITLTGAFAEIHTNNPDVLDLVFDDVTFNITVEDGNCIVGSNVTIMDCERVEAKTISEEAGAIHALRQLNITNSTVIATATNGSAIASSNTGEDEEFEEGSEKIVIQNSNVTAEGGYYNGIFSNGTLAIQQSKVTAEGGNGYPGLFSGSDMTITDSTITAASTESFGIYAGTNLSITGDTEVCADGSVRADESFTITPKEGSLWDVFVGSNAEDVDHMEGSPFEGENIDMSAAARYSYFHSKPHVHSFTKYVYNNDAKVGVDGTETAACDNGCDKKDTRTKAGTALSSYIPTWPTAPTIQKPEVSTGDGYSATLGKDGTTANITVQEGYELVDVTVNGVSKGKVTVITGLKTGDKIEVKVAKMEKPSEAEAVKAELAAINADQFKARSKQIKLKNGNKAVKITWNKPADMDFDGYDVFRSLKRYEGYGKKPFFTTAKQSYINTKGLKEGTKYYYKVRGYVKIDGAKYYTPWSMKAWRTVK